MFDHLGKGMGEMRAVRNCIISQGFGGCGNGKALTKNLGGGEIGKKHSLMSMTTNRQKTKFDVNGHRRYNNHFSYTLVSKKKSMIMLIIQL